MVIEQSKVLAFVLAVGFTGCHGSTSRGRGGECRHDGDTQCAGDGAVFERCKQGVWVAAPECVGCIEEGDTVRCVNREGYNPHAQSLAYYTDEALMTYQLFDSWQSDADAAVIQVEVYPQTGVIPAASFAGSVTIDANEANYASCGLCLLGRLNGRQMMARSGSGTVALGSRGNGMPGNVDLEDVWLREVTVDQESWETTEVPDGALWHVQRLLLEAPASHFPCDLSPVPIAAGAAICVGEEGIVACNPRDESWGYRYDYLSLEQNCYDSSGFCVEAEEGPVCQRCEDTTTTCTATDDREQCESNGCELVVRALDSAACYLPCEHLPELPCRANKSCLWHRDRCWPAFPCEQKSEALCTAVESNQGACAWTAEPACVQDSSPCDVDLAACNSTPGCVMRGTAACVSRCDEYTASTACSDAGCRWDGDTGACFLETDGFCAPYNGNEEDCTGAGCVYVGGAICVSANGEGCSQFHNQPNCETKPLACKWLDERACLARGCESGSPVSASWCQEAVSCAFFPVAAICESCSSLYTQASCEAEPRCAWADSACAAAANTCDSHATEEACVENFCSWENGMGPCVAHRYGCDTAFGVIDCDSAPGCFVSVVGLCQETCSAHADETSCADATGCAWAVDARGKCSQTCGDATTEADCRARGCVWNVVDGECVPWTYYEAPIEDDLSCASYAGLWDWGNSTKECRRATCDVDTAADCSSDSDCALVPY